MAQPPQIVDDRTLISADALTTVLGLRQIEAEEGVMSLMRGRGGRPDLPGGVPRPRRRGCRRTWSVGRISQVEDGRILLEGPLMSNGEPMLIWLTVSDETAITVGEGPVRPPTCRWAPR